MPRAGDVIHASDIKTDAATVNGKDLEAICTMFSQRVSGNSRPKTVESIVDWGAMRGARIGGSEVTNLVNNWSGIRAYGGDTDFRLNNVRYHRGSIFLKKDFRTYDKLLFHFCNDDANWECWQEYETWELDLMLQQSFCVDLCNNRCLYWTIAPYEYKGTEKYADWGRSSSTILAGSPRDGQNCGIVEVYGLIY